MNIYRLDDDGPKPVPFDFDPVREFNRLDFDPNKREELIAQAFGNYIVTLGEKRARARSEKCFVVLQFAR